MGLIKYKPDTRTTTKFSFNVGYVFVGLVIGLIITGLFRGLITPENFASVLDSLLYPAVAFFGVGAARVVAENIGGVKRDQYGNTIPPTPVPEYQVNEIQVENADAIVDNAANVNVDLPPTMGVSDIPTTTRRRR